MVVGMEDDGNHLVIQPSQSKQFALKSKQEWLDKYNTLMIDFRQIEQLEGKFNIPTYWHDKYSQNVSSSVLNKKLGGQVVHQWFLSFEFTFPMELTMALNQIQRRYKEFKLAQYMDFLRNLQKFQSVGAGRGIVLPKMGTIQIEILNCSNVRQYKHGDKYKIVGDVTAENPDYVYNDEIQQPNYKRAGDIMKDWKEGKNEKPETGQGEGIKQTVNDNFMIQWNSQYDRRLDFGLFQMDVTEKKVIKLQLVRERGDKVTPIRAVELRVEDLMDFNTPLKLKYLHMKDPQDAHERNIILKEKNLTTECLQVIFMFFPLIQTLQQQGLDPSYYVDKTSLLNLMRQKRRMQLNYEDEYENLVPLGVYEPNHINKFFNDKFYRQRLNDDVEQGGSNTIKDAFFPQSTQVNLIASIENREKTIRPVMEEATFHMAQARIYEVSQQESSFYQSYGYEQYLQLYLTQAQKQNKQPKKPMKRNPGCSLIQSDYNEEVKKAIPVFQVQDPDLTIDLDMRYQQQNTNQFQTMMGLIRRGIPKIYREKLWFSLLKVKKHVNDIKAREHIHDQDIFLYYLYKADKSRSNLLQLIDYDLSRFQKFPIASNVPPPNTSQGIEKMRDYTFKAELDRTARDQNIKGVVRKVLRAYAMWIEDQNNKKAEQSKQKKQKAQNKKSYIYHRGLIWIVYRLVHGGIINSISTAFKMLIGLAKNLELIFQRNQKTLLLNELQTQKQTFSNILLQDFMLRIVANVEVMYPQLSRKINNYGYPIEYYIGQKFLTLYSDSTMSSDHIYLIWDWVIFYSALEQDNSRFSDVLPLAITLFFFQNIVSKKFVDKIQSAQEIKYLIDNPFLFDPENLNTINFSDRVLQIYRSLFTSGFVSSFVGKQGKIERVYDQLHANYKKEFQKNFYHNQSIIKNITRTQKNPTFEALSPKYYFEQIDAFLKHMGKIQRHQDKVLRANIVDIRILKDYIQQAFNKGVPADATFTLALKYGEQKTKYFILPNTIGKYHGQVFKFPISDSYDTLKILLYINKLDECRNIGDKFQDPMGQTGDSPTKMNKRKFIKHNKQRQIEASSIDAKLNYAVTEREGKKAQILVASSVIKIDNMNQNHLYKAWTSLKWAPDGRDNDGAQILAQPPEPEVLLSLCIIRKIRQANIDQVDVSLLRSIHCRLPEISNFGDAQFTNQQELIQSMMLSNKNLVLEQAQKLIQKDEVSAAWFVNNNYLIIMPTYRPFQMKQILKRSQNKNQTATARASVVQDQRYLHVQAVPTSVKEIDIFSPVFSEDGEEFRMLNNYIQQSSMKNVLKAIGHQGPNFEENRRLIGKISEFLRNQLKRQQLNPSRIIPISLKNILSIITIRTQLRFQDLGRQLLKICSLDFNRDYRQQFLKINPIEANQILQILCQRLMVPIPGFKVKNWIESQIFGSSGKILKAQIMSQSEKSFLQQNLLQSQTNRSNSNVQNVTGIVQRFLNFCYQRIGRKVIYIPGLIDLNQFKNAFKKVGSKKDEKKFLLIQFMTNRGHISTDTFCLNDDGKIEEYQGEKGLNGDQNLMRESKLFSLEGVHQTEQQVYLDSVLNMPFISDWLRMEVSLNSQSMIDKQINMKLMVEVEKDGVFTFDAQSVRNDRPSKSHMGGIRNFTTLSDVRFKIIEYYERAKNFKRLKQIESYVFKTDKMSQMKEINEFVAIQACFRDQQGSVIKVAFEPANNETVSWRKGDPMPLKAKWFFGNSVEEHEEEEEEQKNNRHHHHHYDDQVVGRFDEWRKAYALFVYGDGSSRFLKCEARPQNFNNLESPSAIYKVRFEGSNKWYIRSRKEIILTHSHWISTKCQNR